MQTSCKACASIPFAFFYSLCLITAVFKTIGQSEITRMADIGQTLDPTSRESGTVVNAGEPLYTFDLLAQFQFVTPPKRQYVYFWNYGLSL